jgi:protoheme IX farnesyltransferase
MSESLTFHAGSGTAMRMDSSVRDYVTLLKPGVMMLVVFTGLAGMALAPGHLHPLLQAITLLCIAMGSGAGGAINMWYDRDIDAKMARTAARPVPAGRITEGNALAFGMFLAGFSVMILSLAAGWLAAGMLAFAIFFYVVIYTVWLKRSTPQNIVIGGAAGAFPPVIGWAAVTGQLDWQPWLLFAIVFLWTPPHFWALALYRCGDYARVGIPMLPVVAGVESTKRHMLAYTVLLVAVTLLPTVLGMTGLFYLVCAAALGGTFLWHAVRVWRVGTDAVARKMFGFSILYLFLLFSAMMIDHLLGLMPAMQ